MSFHHTTLPNGLTIIAELQPSAHSIAFGFFVRTGAADETIPRESGVSHFLEHMVFKGTETLSAEQVNRIFDDLGANYNASTGEEVTNYYAAVLPEYLAQAFKVQSEIIYPTLRDDDFETEKQVILEEIGMYADQPMYVAYDHVMQLHFRGHPLGQPILGTTETITDLPSTVMRDYHKSHYRAGNIILVAAGNADWNELVALAETHCGHWPAGASQSRAAIPATPKVSIQTIHKPQLLQQQVMALASSCDAKHPLRWAAEVLAVAIGDDSNGRLYWELVEPGLAEVAELSFSDYDHGGTWLTYLSCDPESAAENWRTIREVYDDVNQDGITEDELLEARSAIKTRLVVRGERPVNRLSGLGQAWISRQEYKTVREELAEIDAVDLATIRRVLDQFPLEIISTVAVGPIESWDVAVAETTEMMDT